MAKQCNENIFKKSQQETSLPSDERRFTVATNSGMEPEKEKLRGELALEVAPR